MAVLLAGNEPVRGNPLRLRKQSKNEIQRERELLEQLIKNATGRNPLEDKTGPNDPLDVVLPSVIDRLNDLLKRKNKVLGGQCR